ncbi:Uma2 family endonuclease [Amycolatopsis jiangsuensis]|uniref:Uma2 family endonuclease n=1 Tax=Amycolatopsis jiangsuensis TaxID=1181879 RepID=A0A840IWP8_9PSEU|nr:Uma2 family endonuclease [Amycolatopsis jiangsuensis]MBB4687026.1 Uma2 family endonuclease [Amycolatopsis jiangsuensis]
MSALEWPQQQLLTLDDWAELPETSEFHMEVVEGVLAVSPRPFPLHQLVLGRVAYLLTRQLPTDLVAVNEMEMVVRTVPLTVRSPDVLVAPTSLIQANPPRIGVAEVPLAVEVLSPGTKRTDEHDKFREYAAAGIEHYWIIDLEQPVSLRAYRLVEGGYADFGEHTGSAALEFAGTTVKLDLDALIDARGQRS